MNNKPAKKLTDQPRFSLTWVVGYENPLGSGLTSLSVLAGENDRHRFLLLRPGVEPTTS